MSLRKIMLASGLIVALPATAAMAQSPEYSSFTPGQTVFDGPYLGLDLGYSDYDGADGISGGVYGGYGRTMPHNLYLGLEANAGYSDADGGVGGADVEIDETYGVSLRPGYVLNENTLLYTRVGWQRTAFEASSPTGSNDSMREGLRTGVGVDFAMSENFIFRTEYNYTWNNDFNAQGTTMDADEHGIRFGGAFTF